MVPGPGLEWLLNRLSTEECQPGTGSRTAAGAVGCPPPGPTWRGSSRPAPVSGYRASAVGLVAQPVSAGSLLMSSLHARLVRQSHGRRMKTPSLQPGLAAVESSYSPDRAWILFAIICYFIIGKYTTQEPEPYHWVFCTVNISSGRATHPVHTRAIHDWAEVKKRKTRL